MKSKNEKLADLLEFSEEYEMDIIRITETNISSREGGFISTGNTGYRTFWASAEENKKKGSGVGIAISSKWEKHLAKIETEGAYILKANFVFRKTKIVFWSIYMPLND